MNDEIFYFLKEDYDGLMDELNKLEKDYKRWGKVSTEDGGVGDWHDNPAYEEGIKQMGMLSGRILNLKQMHVNAEIVDEVSQKDTFGRVTLGCKVILDSMGEGEKKYQIGSFQDFRDNKLTDDFFIISYCAPLAKALLGKKVDDEIDIELGGKRRKFYITEIL